MLGWGISLLVHALGAALLWHAWTLRHAEQDTGPVRGIEVRLIPIAPAAPPAPMPDAAVPRARSSQVQTRAAPRAAPPPHRMPAQDAAASPTAAVPEAVPNANANANADTVTPTDAGTAAPAVDLQAARAAARLIARENGKGLVALPERKPVADPNADRHVVDRFERARRVDCQKARAESANLLANVIGLAVDLAKNAIDDSGCKW